VKKTKGRRVWTKCGLMLGPHGGPHDLARKYGLEFGPHMGLHDPFFEITNCIPSLKK
jgi:hypothetical protein